MRRYQARIRLGPGDGSAVVVHDAENGAEARALIEQKHHVSGDGIIDLQEIGEAADYDADQGPLLTRTEIVVIALAAGLALAALWWRVDAFLAD